MQILSYENYDDDYKQEMIDACIKEYQNGLSNGLTKYDAYLQSIKDFDDEYFYKRKDKKLNDKTLYLSIGISMAFIIIFLSCNQFIPEDKFYYSIWVCFFPNLIFLFTYNIFNLFLKKCEFKNILYNIFLPLMLYFPFILIELNGNNYDFNNYIITSTIFIILEILFYITKNKVLNITLTIVLLISLNILLGYYIIYTREY